MTTEHSVTVPPYRLLLPDGWEEVPADRAGVRSLIERTSAAFRAQHRPELDAQMRTLLERAARKMAASRAIALYLQTSAPEMPVPMSITATVAEGQLGGTLDRQVTELFRDHGAEFLDDDRTIVRWELTTGPRRDADDVAAHVVDYLIPIPGTQRRKALQFTTAIPLPPAPDAEDREVAAALVRLSDLIVSTFTWERESA